MKSRTPYIPRHLIMPIKVAELDGKRVKMVPEDESFEYAYYKYKFGMFFGETRVAYVEIKYLCDTIRSESKKVKKLRK